MDPVYFLGRLKSSDQIIESLKLSISEEAKQRQLLEATIERWKNIIQTEIPEKFTNFEKELKLIPTSLKDFLDAREELLEAKLKNDYETRINLIQAELKNDYDTKTKLLETKFKNDLDARMKLTQAEHKSSKTIDLQRLVRVGPRKRGRKPKAEKAMRASSEWSANDHHTSMCSSSSTLKNHSNIEDSFMSVDSQDDSDSQCEDRSVNDVNIQSKSAKRLKIRKSMPFKGQHDDEELFDANEAGEMQYSFTATSSLSDTMDDSSQQTIPETASGNSEDVLSEPENLVASNINTNLNFGTVISDLKFEKLLATLDSTSMSNPLKFKFLRSRILKLAESKWKNDAELPPNVEPVEVKAKSAKDNIEERVDNIICKTCHQIFDKDCMQKAIKHSATHFIKRCYLCGCCGYLSPSRTNYIGHLREPGKEDCTYSITKELKEQLELMKSSKSQAISRAPLQQIKPLTVRLDRCPLIDDFGRKYKELMKRLAEVGCEF